MKMPLLKTTSILIINLLLICPSYPQCPELIWSDEFEGTALDATKWSIQTGDGCDIGICGWGNNELQNYGAENIEVGEGTLKIIAKKLSFDAFTSGRIRSLGKGDWTYGRFEARMKLPTGQGLWPAFWMLSSTESYGGWPQSGEIDIMELIGSEPAKVHGTIHYGNAWPNNQSSGETFTLEEGIFNDAFHEFAIEWEANQIKWFVDDYLFATKTTSNTNPFRWPFDQDMYLLLNLAIGGNWPGFPNSTTPFPSILEVDYVRVYTGSFPYLEGPRSVSHQAKNSTYYIRNLGENATIEWIVPDDASISNGAGTPTVSFDWGAQSGKIQAVVSDACFTDTLAVFVKVEAPFVKDFTFENFDDESIISYASSTGTFQDNLSNPAPNEVNGSALCGGYQRNASEVFDILTYDINSMVNGEPYISSTERFSIDIHTSAPAGTVILLQLENKNTATASNYPRGRHSRFQAFTEKQNEWHSLTFEFLDQPDGTVPHTSLNQIQLLFASNSTDGSTYYFDNFDNYAQEEIVPIREAELEYIHPVVFPNPASDIFWIKNKSNNTFSGIGLHNLKGQTMVTLPSIGFGQTISVDVSNHPPGVYFLRYRKAGKEPLIQKIILK